MTFLRYLLIQVLAYGIDMGLFLSILHLDFNWDGPILANVVSKLAAGCFAFVAHRNFTFAVEGSGFARSQAARYFLVLAVNVPVASAILGLFLILLPLVVNVPMVSAILGLILLWIPLPVVAKFLSDIVCVSLSYILSKHFIYKVQTPMPDSTVTGETT